MTAPSARDPNGAEEVDADQSRVSAGQRLDRWLWFARAVKSRTLAAALIEAGKIRVNTVKVLKPSFLVKPGDVVTSTLQKDVRILEVVSSGIRRGPAAEAKLLYADLTPVLPARRGNGRTATGDIPSEGHADLGGEREAGSGRPTKRDRRLLDRLQSRD